MYYYTVVFTLFLFAKKKNNNFLKKNTYVTLIHIIVDQLLLQYKTLFSAIILKRDIICVKKVL